METEVVGGLRCVLGAEIEKRGVEAIWEQLGRHDSEHLWAKLRSFQAEACRGPWVDFGFKSSYNYF